MNTILCLLRKFLNQKGTCISVYLAFIRNKASEQTQETPGPWQHCTVGAEEPKQAGLQGAAGRFQKGRADLLPRAHLCRLSLPQPVSPGSLCSFQMLNGSWGGPPPPQYSGLPRRPVRVRKFRFNDFTAKFNTQWTPSKTPAPRRKEGLNGKGGRTGSQPHATEAPLRGCHPQAGGRLLSTVPHAHHCADNLSLHSLLANYDELHWVSHVP